MPLLIIQLICYGIGRLPVENRSPVSKLIGLITRRAIFEARRRQMVAQGL